MLMTRLANALSSPICSKKQKDVSSSLGIKELDKESKEFRGKFEADSKKYANLGPQVDRFAPYRAWGAKHLDFKNVLGLPKQVRVRVRVRARLG